MRIDINDICYITDEMVGNVRCLSLYIKDTWVCGDTYSSSSVYRKVNPIDWCQSKLLSRYNILTDEINKKAGDYIKLRDIVEKCLQNIKEIETQ